jgi:adenine-specific DNA-methyltransferase
MRYIGSKAKVLAFLANRIRNKIPDIDGKIFADLFAGTAIVSKFFKSLGCKIICNDYMTFSYCLQVAHVELNDTPNFNSLKCYNIESYQDAISFLNNVDLIEGFFYLNYCIEGSQNGDYQRNYFSPENARKIDSILNHIEIWKQGQLISHYEEMLLKASLIEATISVSNISGTYGAFLKVDDKRKFKKLWLKEIDIRHSDKSHHCINDDVFQVIKNVEGDILYLDPPYNQRQYPPYYHILETITLNDNPKIYGKTGRRPYQDRLSPFCRKDKVKNALIYLLENANFPHVFLSYNTEGLLNEDEILQILNNYGEVEVFYTQQRKYKSNSNGQDENNPPLKELLFYVRTKK